MPTRDLYAVLGVSRGATDKEIRQAYRRLAREHHPDLHPNDKVAETRFKELSEAYEVLSDATKRAQYDRFGVVGNGRPGGQPGAPGFGDMGWAPTGGGPGVETLIDQLLQGVGRKRPGPRSPRTGQDIEQTIDVTLAEAILGTTRRVQLALHGEPARTLEVTIQPGVTTGTRIRMSGQGSPGIAGGPRGTLFLVVNVLPDDRFERQGDDLSTVIDVPFYSVALGGEVEVPTPTGGRLALTIPSDTRSGQRFRLAGQGVPHLGSSGRGDLYAEVRAAIPENLTETERQLIRQFASLRGA